MYIYTFTYTHTHTRVVNTSPHAATLRPLASEPAARLATLPPTLLLYGERDWVWTPSVRAAAAKVLSPYPPPTVS